MTIQTPNKPVDAPTQTIKNGNPPSMEPADCELLMQFVRHRCETAFADLVDRHGPMVLGVSRHILGNQADADDAFQAVFLNLAQRAHKIQKSNSVGAWLHQVAYRTSMRAAKKRQRREKTLGESLLNVAEQFSGIALQEEQQALHEEIERLPERYRAPLVLCYLESQKQRQAAEALACTVKSLQARLTRGKRMLRLRLVRRGIMMSAAFTAAATHLASCQGASLSTGTLFSATVDACTATVLHGNVQACSHAVTSLTRNVFPMINTTVYGKASLAAIVFIGIVISWTAFGGDTQIEIKPDQPPELEIRPVERTILPETGAFIAQAGGVPETNEVQTKIEFSDLSLPKSGNVYAGLKPITKIMSPDDYDQLKVTGADSMLKSVVDARNRFIDDLRRRNIDFDKYMVIVATQPIGSGSIPFRFDISQSGKREVTLKAIVTPLRSDATLTGDMNYYGVAITVKKVDIDKVTYHTAGSQSIELTPHDFSGLEDIFEALKFAQPAKYSRMTLQQFMRVRTLDLSEFHLNDKFLQDLAKLESLEELNFTNNPSLTNDSLNHLQHIRNLKQLDLSFYLQTHKVDDRGMSFLKNMTKLKSLKLSGRTMITDEGFKNLEGLQTLEYLNLGQTNLSVKGLESIAKLENLQELELYYTHKLTGDCLNTLSSLKSLIHLNLTHATLSGTGLGKLTSLESLNLSQAKSFKDEDWRQLAPLKKLQRLDLSFTKINDDALVHLYELKALRELKLIQCRGLSDRAIRQLTEQLPTCTFILE